VAAVERIWQIKDRQGLGFQVKVTITLFSYFLFARNREGWTLKPQPSTLMKGHLVHDHDALGGSEGILWKFVELAQLKFGDWGLRFGIEGL